MSKHSVELTVSLHFSGDDPEKVQQQAESAVTSLNTIFGPDRVKRGFRTWWFAGEKVKENGKIVLSYTFKRPQRL